LSLETRLAPGLSWDALRAGFRWEIPERFNIAEAMIGARARAEPDRLALRRLTADGAAEDWRFGAVDRAAARLANALEAGGFAPGDRLAILLPQSPEALIAHCAAYRLGGIAVPLFTLFGEEGLAYRLADSGAAALVTDAANLPKVVAIRDRTPALRRVLCVDGPGEGAEGWAETLARASDAHAPVATRAEDPAFLSYTSGTTGPPKGALHAHRCLIGHLPGVRLVHDFLPRPGDVMWTPADWAWMGGLCNVMMPALYWGVPLICHRMERFDPERAFALMAAEGVTSVFAPPTALRLMRGVARPDRFDLRLRTLGSGGEALGAELLGWGREALGVEIAEFYGQTECNKVLANNPAIMAVKPGSTGRAVPGYDVAILDAEGRELPPGETGEIAMRRGGASMFLGYWNLPEKTAEKFAGDWLRSGDEGRMDAEGYVFFSSRADDVITSSGYRIGPSEVEDCLSGHPAVAMAAVVGLPDPVRTEIVAAFVTLRPDAPPLDDALREALAAHVRARLGPHVAPRRIEVVDALPTTATGKIMRREVKRRTLDGG